MDETKTIEEKYRALADRLDEATLRLLAAVEARVLGHGSVSTVASAWGCRVLPFMPGCTSWLRRRHRSSRLLAVGGVRAKGGGRKKLTSKDPTLLRDLDALVEPTTRGDPRSPLR
jgi:hypothetical protein